MTIQKIASLTAEPDDFGISVDACEASERRKAGRACVGVVLTWLWCLFRP